MLRYLLPLLCLTAGAQAQSEPFEKPIAADPDVGPQRCTYYPDLTVRETDTNSPGTGPTYILPGPTGSKRGACVAGGRKIDTRYQAFVGRKGGFLFFLPTDGNGPELFEIRSLKSGKKLYSDLIGGAFKSASVSGEALRLVYARGYEGSCSLLTGGAGCWATMMKEGKFGTMISSQAPPLEACEASYANPRAKTPRTDYSTITYDVDITIEEGKKSVINSRGPVGCIPGA